MSSSKKMRLPGAAGKTASLLIASFIGGASCFAAGPAAVKAGLPAAGKGGLQAASPAAKIDGYVLKQDGKTMGSQIVTITPAGVRCESLRSRTVLLCASPDWKVLFYNARSLRCKTCNIKEFRGYLSKQMVLFSNTSYFDKPVVFNKKLTEFGLPVLLYREPVGYARTMGAGFRKGYVSDDGDVAEIYLKTLKIAGIPAQEGNILSRYFGVPERDEPPINFTWVSVAGEKRSFLTTSQVTPQKVDTSILKPPAGLIPCNTMEEVFLDAASEGTDELIDMFSTKKNK